MKTVENEADPEAFIASVGHAGRREDAVELMALMIRVTGLPPRMWGDSMVGFGAYEYARSDGSRHRFFRTGFSPRKAAMSVYIMPGVARYPELLARLGPHKHSVSCLYLGRLSKVDLEVLEALVACGLEDMDRIYPR